MSENPVRIHQWMDTARMRPLYGLQVRIGSRWAHAVENGEVMLRETREDAEAEATKLREALARHTPDEIEMRKAG